MSIAAERLFEGEGNTWLPIHAREQMLRDLEVLRQLWCKLLACREDVFPHQPVKRSVLKERPLAGYENRY
jgi:hypothetical protein